MKTILALLLMLAVTGLHAAPQFLPLPGTPEGDALAAAAATNQTPPVVAPPAKPIAATNIAVAKPAAVMPPAPAPVIEAPPILDEPPAPPAPPATNSAFVPVVPTAAPAIPLSVTLPHATAPTTTAPAITAPPARNVPRRGLTSPAAAAAAASGVAPASAVAAGAANPTLAAGTAKLLAANPDDVLPAGTIQFQATPLEQVLEIYAKLVNRTILRPATLPAATITIKTQTELTKSEALQALDSVLGMNGITMVPIGTKFVKAVPVGEANQAGAAIENQTDTELPELGRYITHVAQMKYAKPSEVMPVLAPFAKIQGNITALDANGILIIRDYTENVKRMLELIARIDVTVPSEFISEVIPIKYALASDIASALNSVGGTASGSIGGGTGGGGGTGAGVTGRSGTTGSRTGYGSTAGSQTVGGSQFGGNRSPYSPNAGSTTPGGSQPPTFASRLQGLISRAAAPGGGDFQLIGPNKIIADERTNSLLVFASRADMDMIKDIIRKLDVVLAQVLIEAIILDITLGDNFDLGISAGQAPLSSGNLSGGGGLNNAKNPLGAGMAFLNNLIQSGSATNMTPLFTNITPIFSQSTNINFPGSDGLTYFGKLNPTWNVALTALAGKNNVKVLARPSIQTSQNAPASIFVGETRPYITGTYNNGYSGGSQSQYQQSQIGISLNVTPLINPDGLVVMDIQQQVQQVGGSVTIDGNQVPITQDQNASSKVAVRNGETIVMGGFIQNQKSESKSGVPFLMDIPWLGALFRSTSTKGARRELLVMIRPTVLPNPEDAALQTAVQRDRHPALKAAEDEFNKEDVKLLKRANKNMKSSSIKSKNPLDKDEDKDLDNDADKVMDKDAVKGVDKDVDKAL